MHRAPGGCSSPVPWLRGETPRGTHRSAPAEWPNGMITIRCTRSTMARLVINGQSRRENQEQRKKQQNVPVSNLEALINVLGPVVMTAQSS